MNFRAWLFVCVYAQFTGYGQKNDLDLMILWFNVLFVPNGSLWLWPSTPVSGEAQESVPVLSVKWNVIYNEKALYH